MPKSKIEDRTVKIFPASTPPVQDGRLVVGWSDAWPLPQVYEWRQRGKRPGFYNFAMLDAIDRYVYLEDLAGDVSAVNHIRERWNIRDGKDPKRGVIKPAADRVTLKSALGSSVEKITKASIKKMSKKLEKELKKL